jgi:hypothetical protein
MDNLKDKSTTVTFKKHTSSLERVHGDEERMDDTQDNAFVSLLDNSKFAVTRSNGR